MGVSGVTFLVILIFLASQRLYELKIANRNTKTLLRSGAVEFGARHYWVLVSLHTLFLVSMIFEANVRPVHLSEYWFFFFVVFILGQLGRVWVIQTLKGRWTTRIIVSPGRALVTEGPFRYISHPNYLIVAIEFYVIPMMFNLYWTALLFSILNAAVLLLIRLPEEERALRWGVKL